MTTNCCAKGCCLPGSFINQFDGHACWMHFGRPASEWDEITRVQSRPDVALMLKAMRDAAEHPYGDRWRRQAQDLLREYPDAMPSNTQSIAGWLMRVRAMVFCRSMNDERDV